ncbi:MAG: hypothetical protein IJV24_07090 [Prevotella sp.]|nr:hypothetical protein [Prevotella sp.]
MLRMEHEYREQMQRVAMQIVMAYGGVTPELNGVRLAIDSDGDICIYYKGEQQMDFNPELVRKMMRWIMIVGYLVTYSVPDVHVLIANMDNECRKEEGDEDFSEIDFSLLRDEEQNTDSFSLTIDEWKQYQRFVLTEHDRKKLYEECIGTDVLEYDFESLDAVPITRLLEQWGVVIGDRIVWFYEAEELLSLE